MFGNYVVLELVDGAYAALAHLQQGSPTLRAGQQVQRGEVVGRCGNSGNSSEPHVHFQLMDHRWPFVSAGLPFVFTGVRIDGTVGEGVPGNRQLMVVTHDPPRSYPETPSNAHQP